MFKKRIFIAELLEFLALRACNKAINGVKSRKKEVKTLQLSTESVIQTICQACVLKNPLKLIMIEKQE